MNPDSSPKNHKYPSLSSPAKSGSPEVDRVQEIIKSFDTVDPSIFPDYKPQPLIDAAQSLRTLGEKAIDSLVDCLSTLVPCNRTGCAAVTLRLIRDLDEKFGSRSINQDQTQDAIDALKELSETKSRAHKAYYPQYKATIASLAHT